MSLSNSSSSAQELLNALMELRRLGNGDAFRDSKCFRSYLLDIRPGWKKEARAVAALIDAGFLQRLQDADDSGRVIIAGQIRLWLAEELELNTERAQSYSSVLMAFYNGETAVSSAGPSSGQYGLGASSANQHLSLTAPPSHSSGSSGSSADECIAKGARLYAKGQYRDAADWYRKAAEQGDADAQYMLGNMYRDGVGVDSDWDLAVKWYCLAVAQDHAEARQALFSRTAAPSKAAASKPAPPLKPVVSAPPRPNAVSKPAVPPKNAALSLRAVYADKRVGERFEFGRYPQGANGEVMPITWRVLQREKDYLLVIAERGLDCKPYHERFTGITWADCSLRRWLNDVFYEKAFNERERERVLRTRISNNAGPATEDRVFLLSVDEANRLFANDNERKAAPTAYVINDVIKINDLHNDVINDKNYMIDGIGCCFWWLRSRGCYARHAACVDFVGGVGRSRVDTGCFAVRPALKIAL